MKVLFTTLCSLWAYFTFFAFGIGGLFWYVIVLLLSGGKNINGLYNYNRWWALRWGDLNGVKYKLLGDEHLKDGQAYIFVSNHSTNADLPISAVSFNRPYRPLGKVELNKAPVVGYLFRKALVSVDRSNAESRTKSVLALKALLESGVSVLIFPEGTRNKTDKPLKDFYDGAFKLAIETQIPVVPMVVTNAHAVMDNDSWLIKSATITRRFLKPIPTTGLGSEDAQDLKQQVFDLMWKEVERHDPRFNG